VDEGGAFGVQVGTFGTLYHDILRLAGKPVPLASDAVLQRLIRGVIEEALSEGQLPHFQEIAGKPGFLSVAKDHFGELKRAQVPPPTFLKFAAKNNQALQELALLYERYQKQLKELGWADPEGLNWLAVAVLEENPDLCADWPLLVVDGFDSFHGSQLSALKLLGDRITQVLITFPGDLENDRTAFRRFKRSFERLHAALPETVIERLAGSVHLPVALAQFETGLFELDPLPVQGKGHITQIEARTTTDEAREALRWIKARIVRDRLLPQECAIVTPNPELYRPILREAALEFGLPLRFAHGDPLPDAPGITAMLELLTLPLLNWPRRGMLDALSSPYFELSSFGFTDEDTIVMDELSLHGQIIEGLDEWSGALARLASGDKRGHRLYDEATRWPNLPRGDQAQALLKALKAFSDRINPPDARTTTLWVAWLEDLLEDLSFFNRCETPQDRAAALGFREVLRALVLGEAVAGERNAAYGTFTLELRSALESGYFEAPLDWCQPSVPVRINSCCSHVRIWPKTVSIGRLHLSGGQRGLRWRMIHIGFVPRSRDRWLMLVLQRNCFSGVYAGARCRRDTKN
jgi:ATP-dependent helicase/DNAse subunit B